MQPMHFVVTAVVPLIEVFADENSIDAMYECFQFRIKKAIAKAREVMELGNRGIMLTIKNNRQHARPISKIAWLSRNEFSKLPKEILCSRL